MNYKLYPEMDYTPENIADRWAEAPTAKMRVYEGSDVLIDELIEREPGETAKEFRTRCKRQGLKYIMAGVSE